MMRTRCAPVPFATATDILPVRRGGSPPPLISLQVTPSSTDLNSFVLVGVVESGCGPGGDPGGNGGGAWGAIFVPKNPFGGSDARGSICPAALSSTKSDRIHLAPPSLARKTPPSWLVGWG